MNQQSKIWQTKTHPKIAVMRSLPGLGDFLCIVPALRSLRVAAPEAHIALIGLAGVSHLVRRFAAYIDELLIFPGFPGIPEVPFNAAKTQSFLELAQSSEFDLILQMHGNGVCTNKFIDLLSAKQKAGFCTKDGYCPNASSFLLYPETVPEVWRHLRLMEFLGVSHQGPQLEFPILTEDWQEWTTIAARRSLAANYVCIHPGASTADRRWPPEHFAQIADELAMRGLQVVLTGTRQELDLTEAVAAAMKFPSLNWAGCTSLGTLAILLKGAQILICNDTGVSHLADALQTKSVVIFSNSDPVRWAPLNQRLHRIVCTSKQQPSSWLYTKPIVSPVLTEVFDLLEQDFAYAS